MLSWLLDKEDVERAMKGEVITEECVRISDVCPAVGDANANIKELRRYFDPDAWQLVQDVVDNAKKHPVHKCASCNNTIDDEAEASIACESCLRWLHFKCEGLTVAPSKKSWFCSVCTS